MNIILLVIALPVLGYALTGPKAGSTAFWMLVFGLALIVGAVAWGLM